MEKKRKNLKIRCDCGGVFQAKPQEFEGFEIEALVCSKCGFVTLTKEQAKVLMELRRMEEALGENKKVIRIGNTYGVTFPPVLVHQGQKVNVHPIAPNKYVLTFAG